MVFSELLQTITSALDNSSAKNIKKHNSRPINELQGMLLLQKDAMIFINYPKSVNGIYVIFYEKMD